MADQAPWQRVAHASGFTMQLPPDWEIVRDPPPEVALVAREPDSADGFRVNVVVTVEDLAALTFEDWQLGCDQLLATTLADYLLLDLERAGTHDRPAARRLAQHAVSDARCLTMEQWVHKAGTTGLTVTATTPTLRYARAAATLTRVAESLRIGDVAS